jgi:hypothetical protein
MEVSSHTSLFGDCRARKMVSDDLTDGREYQEMMNCWSLNKIIRAPPKNPEDVDQTPNSVTEIALPSRHEIIKGSTGSRIFELLGKFSPVASVRPIAKNPDPKTEAENTRVKRKLVF